MKFGGGLKLFICIITESEGILCRVVPVRDMAENSADRCSIGKRPGIPRMRSVIWLQHQQQCDEELHCVNEC